MIYLNTDSPYLLFQDAVSSEFFVDKSMMIDQISRNIRTENRYICITRPRRFGKSMNAHMLGAYYTKGKDSGESFIFIFDEWDSIFYKDFMSSSDKNAFLSFLKNLLKDQPYVELAYMTGVLPIAKYSSGSELNMFDEYNFMDDTIYDRYFGFSEEEVKGFQL